MQIGWKNKMRKREEIEGECGMSRMPHNDSLVVLEVLLDIRELLEDINNE